MGNRITEFSQFIVLSHRYGLRLKNPAFDEYAANFEGSRKGLMPSFPPARTTWPLSGWFRSLLQRAFDLFSRACAKSPALPRQLRVVGPPPDGSLTLDTPEFRALARKTPLLLIRGWFITLGSPFSAQEISVLREYFRPTAKISSEIDDCLKKVRQECDVLIGVHIRQTDYQLWRDGRFYFSPAQYRNVLSNFDGSQLGGKVGLLICSDSNPPLTDFGDFPITRGPGTDVGDLYALASCDYIVGPPSTYSRWASFFGNVPLYTIVEPDRPISVDDFSVVHAIEPT